MRLAVPISLALPLLVGCNRYELFRVGGYEQATFTNRADILFVIDNSPSMSSRSQDMAVSFDGFIRQLDTFEQDLGYSGLPDAVTNFVDYVQDPGAYLDYNFSLVSLDVATDEGELLGPSIERGEPNVATKFINQLACEGTCLDNSLPTYGQDPPYVCGEPLGDNLVQEYLDCECGAGSWEGNCGSATEEGLEAVLMALCRAVPNPPTECFADVIDSEDNVIPALISDDDRLSNEGMLRENANFIPVIVSNEGDKSRRLFDQVLVPEAYQRLFDQFPVRKSWVYIGSPTEADGSALCPGEGFDWSIGRYDYFVNTTDGLKIPISTDQCNPVDFEQALQTLADLLSNLVTTFPLQAVPVPGSIVVLVDNDRVDESDVTGTDRYGLDTYSDGWSYRSADNTVVFHGTAIPGYNAEVEVFYQPIDGMPRELPF